MKQLRNCQVTEFIKITYLVPLWFEVSWGGNIMILYKYYGFKAGLKALSNGQLGFRSPKNFNDPFELSFLSNSNGPYPKLEELKHIIDALRDTVVVLSLTRTASNPLMWAHYGQEHTGFVIGYDVSDDFLSSQDYNLIPVTAGDVVYTNTKSPHILNPQVMDRLQNVYLSGMGDNSLIREPETLALARKIFLTKHSSWVYEEEVRAVKILDSMFDVTEDFQSDPRRSHYVLTENIKQGHSKELIAGLSIFNYKVPIKEVYLGLRNSFRDEPEKAPQIKGSKYFKFEMDDKSWELNPIDLTYDK